MVIAGDLSFLSNSMQHIRLAGVHAQADINAFLANTPALEEAVRYWKTPVEFTDATIAEEMRLLRKYEPEIRIVQQYLWNVYIARELANRRNEPPSLLGRVITVVSTAIDSILPASAIQSDKQTLYGVICLIVGLACACFVSTLSYIPSLCGFFAGASGYFLIQGISLIITKDNPI